MKYILIGLIRVYQLLPLHSHSMCKFTPTCSNYMIDAIKQVFSSTHMHMLWKASLKVYFLSLVIGIPLGLFFAYAIYKKLPFHSGFRVFLFLPSILSAIVVATIYQFFVEQGLPKIIEEIFKVKKQGFLENPDSRFGTLMFYSIFTSFGTSVLMYSNSMRCLQNNKK